MSENLEIEGIITALMTPLDDDEDVKERSLKKLLDFQIENGVSALFLLGTAGEGMKLPLETRKKVTEKALNYVSGRIPVILHVGTQSTKTTLELVKHSTSFDIDALSAVGPFFYKPDLRGLVHHYKRISETTDVPLIVYNNSGRQGYNINPDKFGRIADEVETIAGVKDTSHSIEQTQEFVRRFGSEYSIFGAGDALIYSNFAIGCSGHISLVSNPFPELSTRLWEKMSKEEYKEARRIQFRINEIRNLLKQGPALAPYKEVLNVRGIEMGKMSSPLRSMDEEEKNRMREKLRDIGVNMNVWK